MFKLLSFYIYRSITATRFRAAAEQLHVAVAVDRRDRQTDGPLASTSPGMPGTHPPIFWLGGRQREYPPQYYYVLSDIANQYRLPSIRSASSQCGDGWSPPTPHTIRWFVPPTLNSRWRHWDGHPRRLPHTIMRPASKSLRVNNRLILHYRSVSLLSFLVSTVVFS